MGEKKKKVKRMQNIYFFWGGKTLHIGDNIYIYRLKTYIKKKPNELLKTFQGPEMILSTKKKEKK